MRLLATTTSISLVLEIIARSVKQEKKLFFSINKKETKLTKFTSYNSIRRKNKKSICNDFFKLIGEFKEVSDKLIFKNQFNQQAIRKYYKTIFP